MRWNTSSSTRSSEARSSTATGSSRRRRPQAMRLRDLLHPVRTRQPGAPVRAQLLQTPPARVSDRKDNDDGEAGCGKDRPDERNRVAVTLTVGADPIPRGLLYNAASGGDGGNGFHRSNGGNGGERSGGRSIGRRAKHADSRDVENANTSRHCLSAAVCICVLLHRGRPPSAANRTAATSWSIFDLFAFVANDSDRSPLPAFLL